LFLWSKEYWECLLLPHSLTLFHVHMHSVIVYWPSKLSEHWWFLGIRATVDIAGLSGRGKARQLHPESQCYPLGILSSLSQAFDCYGHNFCFSCHNHHYHLKAGSSHRPVILSTAPHLCIRVGWQGQLVSPEMLPGTSLLVICMLIVP
jgi:hypothetical protein